MILCDNSDNNNLQLPHPITTQNQKRNNNNGVNVGNGILVFKLDFFP